ncbi:DsbA family protein [Erythrobacter sp. LQ02-29]|uniref:DsbA family protein n=1 Tax=Erythrobacter sp. LQ02-29 TaxID=2920384 RepID=UPI001F4D59DF|nr:thioredoxin domain-containing protein [Erythrobacter sp. LQ02-29]MCP9222774.1 DsbA family protein [Erythrobacter sp. LQ02-29]
MRNTIRAVLLVVAALGTIAATKGNWLATTETGDVWHSVGNPDAPVKLAEYISYTCPHCGDFARSGEDALKLAYIPTGNVQVEVRHYIRDDVDLTAALLAWCGKPADFTRNHAILMHAQPQWLAARQATSAGQRQRWETGTTLERRRAMARDLGFYELFRDRYTTPQLDRCLADDALADRLEASTQSYRDDIGVTGTPSFTLNGVLLAGTYSWDMLAPQIDARLPAGATPARPVPVATD